MLSRPSLKIRLARRNSGAPSLSTLILTATMLIWLSGCTTVNEKFTEIKEVVTMLHEISQANKQAKSDTDPSPEETAQNTPPKEPTEPAFAPKSEPITQVEPEVSQANKQAKSDTNPSLEETTQTTPPKEPTEPAFAPKSEPITQANKQAKSDTNPSPEETAQNTPPKEPTEPAFAPKSEPITQVDPEKHPSPLPSSIIPFQGERYDGQLFPDLAVNIEEADDGLKIPFLDKSHATQSIPSFMDEVFPAVDDLAHANTSATVPDALEDYWPGYKDQIVYYKLGEQLLSVHPVSLLKERTIAIAKVSANVQKKAPTGWETQAKISGTTIGYASDGDVAMLYRWKASEASIARSGIIGLDIALLNFDEKYFGKSWGLPAQVYYLRQGEIHTAELQMIIRLPANIKPKWRIF